MKNSTLFKTLAFAVFLAGSVASAQEVTYSEHIAPIIFKSCYSCHRDGEVAPFSLKTYQDAASRAQLLNHEIQEGHMPPWKPVPAHGDFADVRRLTDAEKELFQKWTDEGAPEGDPAKTPQPPIYAPGSQLGVPDLVLKMSQSFTLKGDGKDLYQNFVLPTGLLQNKNIAAIEFRPGNAKIVHHALMYLDINGSGKALDAKTPEYGYVGFGGPGFNPAASLFGWVPGAQARFFPQGIGFTFPKNSDIVVQLHYAPVDVPESDQSSINIFFADNPSIRPIVEATISPNNLATSFVIPANSVKSFKGVYSVKTDFSLMMIAPHMHLLGRDAKAYAVTPAKDTIKLIWIKDWDFMWQGAYTYKHLLKIPKNSKVYYEASYDNTAGNPRNPNSPPKLVQWGEGTADEMFLCYFFGVPYQPGDESISTETTTSGEEHNFYSGNVLQLSASPNPAQGQTKLSFYLPKSAPVTLEIYNLQGEKMLTVLKSQSFEAGANSVNFNAANLPQGAYVARIVCGADVVSQQFSVVK